MKIGLFWYRDEDSRNRRQTSWKSENNARNLEEHTDYKFNHLKKFAEYESQIVRPQVWQSPFFGAYQSSFVATVS